MGLCGCFESVERELRESSTMKSIIKDIPIKKRRKFDEASKLEVVRNCLASGKSAAVVFKQLCLGEGLLFA